MSFNGSGVFQRLYNWTNDAAANIKIRADRFDNEMDGMATGLSTCLTKDGQTTVTANLPMATYRHTGVGNGSARTDYAALGQVQDGKINWVAVGGTADAITADYSPSVTALVDGQLFYVRAGAANATTTPTFSPNGLTARTIVKDGGTALVAGDIVGAGHELILRYNLANTRYELLNPNVSGFVSLTGNETIAGDKTFTGDISFTGDIALTSSQLKQAKGADIASATALPLLTDGNFFDVTGTTTITSINTSGVVGTKITLQFDDILILTHNSSDLVLPTGANITTSAGDIAEFVEYAAGDWVCVNYSRFDGSALNENSIVLGSPTVSTSGTSIPYTGIPSGVKKITIGFVGVSTSGTDAIMVQLGGSGGNETAGYVGVAERRGESLIALSSGFYIGTTMYAFGTITGTLELTLIDSSTNTWLGRCNIVDSGVSQFLIMSGSKDLSSELTQLTITTIGGSDTFDLGKVNIAYEV